MAFLVIPAAAAAGWVFSKYMGNDSDSQQCQLCSCTIHEHCNVCGHCVTPTNGCCGSGGCKCGSAAGVRQDDDVTAQPIRADQRSEVFIRVAENLDLTKSKSAEYVVKKYDWSTLPAAPVPRKKKLVTAYTGNGVYGLVNGCLRDNDEPTMHE